MKVNDEGREGEKEEAQKNRKREREKDWKSDIKIGIEMILNEIEFLNSFPIPIFDNLLIMRQIPKIPKVFDYCQMSLLEYLHI